MPTENNSIVQAILVCMEFTTTYVWNIKWNYQSSLAMILDKTAL